LKAVADNQRGGAMVFVTLVGLVISMGFAMFLSSTVLVEQRAVEASLARSRAYWAQMGHMHYAMSRISKSKMCNSCLGTVKSKDTELTPILQAYLNELNAIKTWSYPDEAAGYTITITETAAVDEEPTRQTYSGWLKMTSSYATSALVSGLDGHLPLMELRLCVGRASAGSKCGDIDGNNGGDTTAYFSISRLTNLPG
jgi:hypothetical protein